MSTLSEDLRKYFQETPQEKIMSDWALSEKYDTVGPPIDEFIETSKRYYSVECSDINTRQEQISNIISNPKYNLRVSSY